MLWKNKEINKYPDILLSHCVVENVQLENDKIIVTFSEHGFLSEAAIMTGTIVRMVPKF